MPKSDVPKIWASVAAIALILGATWIVNRSIVNDSLLLAVSHRDLPLVMDLLQRGADPSCEAEFGDSPLSLAAEQGNVETVRVLLENGADPDKVRGSLGPAGPMSSEIQRLLDDAKTRRKAH